MDPKQTLESALPKQFFIEESLFLNQAGWIAWISSHVLEIGDREKVIGALREIFQSVKDPTRILGIPAGSYSLDAMLDICCDLLPKLQSYTRKNNR